MASLIRWMIASMTIIFFLASNSILEVEGAKRKGREQKALDKSR